MKRSIAFFTQFLLVAFIAAGLSSCASGPTPTQDLTPLQDAYSVRDSIIIAKKGLNDTRAAGKISKDAYDRAWAIAEDADKIVTAQMKSAHEGMVSKSALETANAKINQVAAVNGGVK